jgi:hypothetical protein
MHFAALSEVGTASQRCCAEGRERRLAPAALKSTKVCENTSPI